MFRVRTEFLLAQYREAYESMRQHSRLVWQIPPIVATIDGAVLVSAFTFLQTNWVVREVLIVFALVLTVALFHAMNKHRYFDEIEQGTLSQIEDELNVKRIQRLTVPHKDSWARRGYWCQKAPSPWSLRSWPQPLPLELSAYRGLFVAMWFFVAGLVFLAGWNVGVSWPRGF